MYKLGYSVEVPNREPPNKAWFYELHGTKRELLDRASQLASQTYVTKVTLFFESMKGENNNE